MRHGRGPRSGRPVAAARAIDAGAGVDEGGKRDRKALAKRREASVMAPCAYITIKTSSFSISTSKRRSRSLP